MCKIRVLARNFHYNKKKESLDIQHSIFKSLTSLLVQASFIEFTRSEYLDYNLYSTGLFEMIVGVLTTCHSGFGGLEVACWPLVPKFADSNPAKAFGFFRAKKSSARLPSEGK